MDNEYMKELSIKDFLLQMSPASMGHYFSYDFDDNKQLCLESCMSGYCVAIYDQHKDLVGEKTCTKLQDKDRIPYGTMIGDTAALTAALEIANIKVKEIYGVFN